MTTPSLGRYGAYLLVQDYAERSQAKRAGSLEEMGYGTLWIAGNAPGDLAIPESILAATESVAVGTAIVNVWAEPADHVAESFHRVEGRHPGRFVLGVGIGHREMTGDRYQKPFPTLVKYVDRLLELGVPGDRIVLAALRAKALELAREKTAGALPYFTTVEHTGKARSALGPDRTLAVVQIVTTDEDRAANRAVARKHSAFYLGLQNYVNNLKEAGFPDLQVGDEPSDELLEALIPLGGVERPVPGPRGVCDQAAVLGPHRSCVLRPRIRGPKHLADAHVVPNLEGLERDGIPGRPTRSGCGWMAVRASCGRVDGPRRWPSRQRMVACP